ncbi:ribbon-helix-helix domain-containing protein [Mesorhizobium sp.]|uniref:ribbon-helix-helix domain-containing protein n=1 Tax=Mesorhizobium sp. TaxID=1871066 RepID=UPI000FE8C98C|nr:ribbon-helix-helix domain-containing protein [Mesorhizobium sp.]RWO46323.1 MAG: CopG family transcriptional regulator [Mesorhizobium sp.]
MINGGVSHNRVVVHLPDSLKEFLESEIARTGHNSSAIIRQALAQRQKTRRAETIEQAVLANEGAC